MVLLGLAMLLILVVIGFIFLNQITTFAQDGLGWWNQATRDNDSKIPKPSPNTIIYDMVIKFEPKWKNALQATLVVDNILFLNQEGDKISCAWTNQHKASTTKIINLFSVMDFFGKRFENDEIPKGEIIVPAPNFFGSETTLSFTLIDNTGKKLELPHHQNIKYKFPAGVDTFGIKETLVFRDLQKGSYQLWITPVDNNDRFADHGYGEPYKQKLTCSG